jgi:hypothetical protein
VAVVLSTLLIAALFLPIRRRVQDIIDRRFNRMRYDAEKTIQAFAATVRNETDLDALTVELLRVIQETMEPESLSIWLLGTSGQGPFKVSSAIPENIKRPDANLAAKEMRLPGRHSSAPTNAHSDRLG